MNRRIPTIAAAVTLAAGVGAGIGGTVVALADEDPSTPAVDRATPVAEAATSNAALYKRVVTGVVQIRAQSGPGGATGSGFVIDDQGHVVTNQHVVDDSDRVTVEFSDGRERPAEVVGTDPSTDIAVLDVNAAAGDLEPLRFGSETSLEVGDPLIAIGSPFGLSGTLTTGVVSALGREIRAPDGFTIRDAIQTDAALNNGNSGGPVFDSAGRVVGVAAQIRSESGGNDGVGYAIPAGTAQDVARELIENGQIEHAYLGVSLAAEGDARIVQVVEGSPAQEAGLRSDDVVTEIDGKRVTSGDELRAAIDAKKPGDTIRLTVRRGSDEREFSAELTSRPSSAQ